ncbi:Transmembrane protein, partial [Phytophthora palmivora]
MAPTPSGRNVHDLERLSAVSITKDPDQSSYANMKTPDANTQILEDGALRPGGMPVLTSKKYIGLLFQYAAVGVVYGMLPETIYPFMQEYLNCSGAQVAAAKELVVLPWSFKVFFGILSDFMAIMPIGKPYYTVAADRDIDTADYTQEIEARINYDAPSEGAKYIVIMFFAAVGYVLSDVCSDSIVCELAQQEPLAKRGKTQSAIYTVRTVLVILGELLVGFCFNGEDYGGDFDFSLSFPQLMIIMTIVTAPILPIAWFFIQEEKTERQDFRKYIADFWNLLCKRVVYQIIAYHFFAGIFSGISYTASSPVQSYMVDVTPINSTLNDVLGHVCFMIGIMVTSKYGLHWNWRGMIVLTGIVVIIVDCAVALITVWDVFRNQWFWLGPPIAVQIPSGVSWIIALFVTVEIAGVGNEGAVYGLVTTVGNLATPFATTITLLIDGPFNITNARVQSDDHSVRVDITYTIIISYAMTIFSWVFLFLLPRQKEETQELARAGGSNKILGGITIFYLSFSLRLSVVSITKESITKERITKDGNESYTGMKTPDGTPELLEDGAIRPGGMPNLMSRDHFGLVAQYAAVGVVYGMLPETVYPFMQQYLNCSGAQVAAAKELVILPWSFKVFYGILSDCFPVFGYRRRPYMLIGWVICISMLLLMAIMPIGQPYYTVASDRDVLVADYTPEIEARINYSAPSQGAKYVIIMFFAAFGYVLSDVCSDSIVCELAQQEPLAKR